MTKIGRTIIKIEEISGFIIENEVASAFNTNGHKELLVRVVIGLTPQITYVIKHNFAGHKEIVTEFQSFETALAGYNEL